MIWLITSCELVLEQTYNVDGGAVVREVFVNLTLKDECIRQLNVVPGASPTIDALLTRIRLRFIRETNANYERAAELPGKMLHEQRVITDSHESLSRGICLRMTWLFYAQVSIIYLLTSLYNYFSLFI